MNIHEFIEQFTDEKIEIEKIRSEVYKKADLKQVDARIESISAPLGMQRKNFKPSLYLLEWLSKRSKNKVFVNDEAEWLFLCGRDIFEQNITKDDSTNHVFLVQNERDENLGMGMFTRGMIKNLKDRGDFLRRE